MVKEIIVCSGALVYALNTKRFLFLHRAKGRHDNLWGLVGGTNEGSETPWEKTIPLETFISNDSKFHFYTYLCVVEDEFLPTLNDEHNGYAWTEFNKWPKPLHYGLRNTLSNKINLSKLETVFKVIDLMQ